MWCGWCLCACFVEELVLALGLVVVVSVDAHGANEHGGRYWLVLATDVQQALVHDVSVVELLEPVAVFSREALGLELMRPPQVLRRTAAVRRHDGQLEVDVVVIYCIYSPTCCGASARSAASLTSPSCSPRRSPWTPTRWRPSSSYRARAVRSSCASSTRSRAARAPSTTSPSAARASSRRRSSSRRRRRAPTCKTTCFSCNAAPTTTARRHRHRQHEQQQCVHAQRREHGGRVRDEGLEAAVGGRVASTRVRQARLLELLQPNEREELLRWHRDSIIMFVFLFKFNFHPTDVCRCVCVLRVCHDDG